MKHTPVLSLILLFDFLESENNLARSIGPTLAPGLSGKVFWTLNSDQL